MKVKRYLRTDIVIAMTVALVAGLFLRGVSNSPPPPKDASPGVLIMRLKGDQMPVMLSELIGFTKECYEKYGDIPVLIKMEDDESTYMAEEQRVMRDMDTKQTAFVLADYEIGIDGCRPDLTLVES